LGRIYIYGLGVEKDYEKAFGYCKVAAEQGDSGAQNLLGVVLETKRDYIGAIEWYEKAATHNHLSANYNLGDIYYDGRGVEQDYNKAIEYYKIAAGEGDSNAQNRLGYMYANDQETKKDVDSAIKWYRKAAEQNHSTANYNLGDIYYEGQGVEQDYSKAIEYYKIAAGGGHNGAQFQLGYCYLLGHGCDKDEQWGLRLMEESSDDDDMRLEALGESYHTASSKHRNFLKSLRYYLQVPQYAPRSYALRGIGLLYEHGDGVEQDYQNALAYYQDAAKEHNKAAYYSIALLYYYGYGVSKDYTTSFEWFEKVITEKLKLGATHVCVLNEGVYSSKTYSLEPESFIYGEAHFYLGIMFKNGQGTVKNKEQAEKHFKLAVSYGSEKKQNSMKKRVRLLNKIKGFYHH
jgi:TPR repeat protein